MSFFRRPRTARSRVIFPADDGHISTDSTPSPPASSNFIAPPRTRRARLCQSPRHLRFLLPTQPSQRRLAMAARFSSSALARNVTPALLPRHPSLAVRALSYTNTLRQKHSPSAPSPTLERPKPVIPYASRLKDGRALALDVWSVFK